MQIKKIFVCHFLILLLNDVIIQGHINVPEDTVPQMTLLKWVGRVSAPMTLSMGRNVWPLFFLKKSNFVLSKWIVVKY